MPNNCTCGQSEVPDDFHAVGCPVHPGYILASQAITNLVEYVAIEHDRAEIQRLKVFLETIDPHGPVQFAGKSVVDWAISLLPTSAFIHPKDL